MSTTIFICQLPTDKQKQIEKAIKDFLYIYGYRGQELKEVTKNAMSSRLCDISENINIYEFI